MVQYGLPRKFHYVSVFFYVTLLVVKIGKLADPPVYVEVSDLVVVDVECCSDFQPVGDRYGKLDVECHDNQ